jgi:hypothetical protein
MTLWQVVCAVGAFLCGVRALGYGAILQFGGVRPPGRQGIVLVLCGSALLFLVLSLASAYAGERTKGARAIAVKALYFNGVYGLPPIALSAVASRGAVLQMPAVMGIAVLFVCLVLFFRRPMRQPVA